MNTHRLCLPLTVLLVFCYAQAQPSSLPSFREVTCPADGPVPADRCGFVSVPEEHAEPTGKRIDLFVAIKHASAILKRPDPIFYLEGGPGAPGSFAAGVLGEIFFDRDVVGIDQRGIGRSTPTLQCPQVNALYNRQDVQSNAGMLNEFTKALIECGRDLKMRGVNLGAYRAAESALDIDDVRRALRYDRVNLYGSSYGSRLAQEIMRRTPAMVRSAVLDSVIPTSVDRVSETPRAVDESLKRVFAVCAADKICNGKYPKLSEVYQQVFRKLNTNPLKVKIKGSGGLLDGHGFQGLVLGSLYFSFSVTEVPSLVFAAQRGDTTHLENSFSAKSAEFIANGVSWGAFYTHECQGEVAYSSRANLTRVYLSLPQWKEALGRFPGIASAGIFDVCNAWELSTPSPDENEPVRSSIPALLLGGEFDPVTPPTWLALAARRLTNAQIVILSGQAHAVGLTSHCGVMMVRAFIHDPTKRVDATCTTSEQIQFN